MMWIMKLFGRQAPGSMTCRHVGEVLQEYLDGYIDDERTSRIAAHLDECRRCGMEAEAYERIKATLATLATTRADLPADSLGRLRDFGERLARGESPPTRMMTQEMEIPAAPESLVWLTTSQMIEVDRVMIDELGIGLAQMMESAGRDLAHLTRVRFLDGDPRDRRVVVLAGTGGNGGGALVAARRLHGWGAGVTIVTTAGSERFTDVPAAQLARLERLDIRRCSLDDAIDLAPFEVVLDGVIGYSLDGSPRGAAAEAISVVNSLAPVVVSLDVPSGVSLTTGVAHDPVVRATATLTLALPKLGLRESTARSLVGELYLGDIGVPEEAYRAPTLNLEPGAVFSSAEVPRIW